LPAAKKIRFMQNYRLSDYNAGVLVADMELANYFEVGAAQCKNPNAVANWLVNDLLRELASANLGIGQSPVKPLDIVELVEFCDNGAISSKQAKEVFIEMFKTGKMPHLIIEEKGMSQVSDTGALEKWCAEAINANPQSVEAYKSGKTSALNHLKGQVMKLSKGKDRVRVVAGTSSTKLTPPGK